MSILEIIAMIPACYAPYTEGQDQADGRYLTYTDWSTASDLAAS